MALTEILANQHYVSFHEALADLPVRVELLTGSVKTAQRKPILAGLEAGEVHILIGTHALIEPGVQFKRLGLAIIDEQHRFGVAQRSKLWAKANPAPHVLVMTATPIPRTLAMTAYGDLDVSVIDEMPPGRKPIKTVHRNDEARLSVFQFMEDEIKRGRQVYVVYPLIEESATLDHKDLMDGYESLSRRFPLPDFRIGIVHGRMKPEAKDMEMERFANGTSHIMVATTVISGSQRAQRIGDGHRGCRAFRTCSAASVRGRVGRGAEQSYCILMTGNELSKDGRRRLKPCANDGFELAEVDMGARTGRLDGHTAIRRTGPQNGRPTARQGIAHHRPVHWDPHSRGGSAPRIASRYPQRCVDTCTKGRTNWSRISELGSMNWQRGLTVGGVIAAVLGSAAWVLSQRNAKPQYLDPTDVVSDAFDHWEQPAAWPNGLEVQDSVSCTLTAFYQRAKAVSVYHSTSAPTVLPAGWISVAWQGGWIMGVALEEWELEPGAMAAYWQPRSGGRTVQVLLGDGTVESSFERQGRAGRATKLITQMGEQPPPSEPVLPQSWEAWFERVAAASGIDVAAVGAIHHRGCGARFIGLVGGVVLDDLCGGRGCLRIRWA